MWKQEPILAESVVRNTIYLFFYGDISNTLLDLVDISNILDIYSYVNYDPPYKVSRYQH